MAITGGIFVAFVVVHMLGNLKVYQGPEAFNAYAAWLRTVGYPLIPHNGVLWGLRVVLLASLVVHMWAGLSLWARGRAARGRHRRRSMPTFMAFGARSMVPTGLVLAAFIVVHLLDLTVGAVLAPEAFRAGAESQSFAYQNLIASFSRVWMALFYAVTMVLLGLHVFHGWRTMTQDLGLTGARTRAVWVSLGAVLAVAVLLGNAMIPVLVLTGVLT